MKITFVLFLLLGFAFKGIAEELEKKSYQAGRTDAQNIIIDGHFDEVAWETANWENQFIQFEPKEGRPPSQQTEFAILYDENNIYVAVKAIDTSTDSISMRLTRRDITDGDIVGILLDTYHDERTGFAFVVSAAGVKSDFVMSNDGQNEDASWDPIWWVKTTKTKNGWNAEMKIPQTQLRFEQGDEQTWGMQILRYLFRKDELSAWQPMKREKAGFVSQFGIMNGIKNIQPKNTFDVMPYLVARTERFEKEPGNPFLETGRKKSFDAGIDAKIGLTNYLTMDLSVNPDFGQVEADPSEVNLSTYETFFEEKRPFFIEGKNILTYSLSFGDGDLATEGLFYSRRIGRRPHYYPDLADNEYSEMPDFTRILAAAKITGKTRNGWSVGILESVTAEENAKIKGIGNGRTQPVEPLTNFLVGRIQKDFNEGNTYLGGMLTAVNRSIDNDQLEFLHKNAYSGGIDFVHKWDNKNWQVDAGVFFSQVNGTEEAIRETQNAYIRNFNRPDANYVTYDPTRTSLTGHGGKFSLSKLNGRLKFGTIFNWKSPGLELNDVGFAQQVDQVLEVIWSGYNFYEPFSIFRNARINLNQHALWDFGGNRIAAGGNLNGGAQFKNFWHIFANLNVSGKQLFNSALRGGPALKVPGYKNLSLGLFTNSQKKLSFQVQASKYFSNEKAFRNIENYNLTMGYRPIKSLRIDIAPGLSMYNDNLQYVDQFDFANQKRYLFAHINRYTLNMSFRINYNITPDLTIQYWGQPFIATGDYSEFKYITNSKAEELTNRYYSYLPEEITYHTDGELYVVDENRDGTIDYSFEKPDFNVKEFLSNLVLRWEYQPGSTLFLVWSQNRSAYHNYGDFTFSRDIDNLFDEKAHNIFLVKLSYRFGR